MLIINELSFGYAGEGLLFNNTSFKVNAGDKVALVGNNGSGKSTLLKIIAGEIPLQSGEMITNEKPCYVPQVFGQLNHLTIAGALGISDKLYALQQLINGDASEKYYDMLADDWTIEERSYAALEKWELPSLDLSQKMATLSGGQKTKVLLAGISIHTPAFVLLDEPTNHLDARGRELLYHFMERSKATLMLVSHDRKLLNSFNTVYELDRQSIKVYGGNYDFFVAQKQIENAALHQHIRHHEKALRKAKEKERAAIEQQEKLNSRGKAKQEKAGVARIMLNTLRNHAEKSTAKLKDAHAEKTSGISNELKSLRSDLPAMDKMKFAVDDSSLYKGKVLVAAKGINFSYHQQTLWPAPLDIEIRSGQRLLLKGGNGSGKTTLIKLLLGDLQPATGQVYRAFDRTMYIDQDYSLISNHLTVYEQLQQFNNTPLQEHELKIQLSRFLFTASSWNKSCNALSGGERMRLILCCLTVSNRSPDIIILDEPTNNLDIQNIEILTSALLQYKGTLVVISHDETFVEEINVQESYDIETARQ